MVVGEPVDVVVECVEHRRGDHACLPGAPPNWNLQRQASSIRSADVARTAPIRQPRPLEKQTVTVSATPPQVAADAARHGCVQEPRAVEMNADADLPGRRDGSLVEVERPDAAPRSGRLLEHDARRLQDAVAQARPLLQVRGREPAGLRRDAAHHEPAVRRCAARLVDENVRPLLRE